MSEQKPSVGRIVHYVSYGTPGGEYKSECRAATITSVGAWVDVEATEAPEKWGDQPMRRVLQRFDPNAVSLCVQNPTGLFFNERVQYDDPANEQPGAADCPNQASHDNPFRYCACGWIEASPRGGTWHWPERA